MRLGLTEDQVALRDGVDRLCADVAAKRPLGDARKVLWTNLTAMGWGGLAAPEVLGGVGGSLLDIGFLMRAMGRHNLVTPFLSSILLGARTLGLAAESPQVVALAGAALSGQTKLALAHQERDDFNPVLPTTKAERAGGGWRLTGRKRLALGAPEADWLLVSASAEAGMCLFLVAAKADGVGIRPYETLRAETAGDLELDLVLPAEACILGPADAGAVLSRITDEAMVALGWEAAGAMVTLLEETTAYVKTRQQFGKPIAAFQTVQHRIAEMAVHCEEAVSILELASLQTADAPLRRFASAAKVKVGAAAKFVSETAVQLHGGIGVTEELPVGGYLRLLLNYQLSFGAADRHLARYAAATIPSRASALSSVLG